MNCCSYTTSGFIIGSFLHGAYGIAYVGTTHNLSGPYMGGVCWNFVLKTLIKLPLNVHNKGLHNLYSSPDIVSLRWAGLVARIVEIRNTYRILTADHFKHLSLDGRAILKWIVEKCGVTGLNCLEQDSVCVLWTFVKFLTAWVAVSSWSKTCILDLTQFRTMPAVFWGIRWIWTWNEWRLYICFNHAI